MIEYFEDFGDRWNLYTITCFTLKAGFFERIPLFFSIVLFPTPTTTKPTDTPFDCTED